MNWIRCVQAGWQSYWLLRTAVEKPHTRVQNSKKKSWAEQEDYYVAVSSHPWWRVATAINNLLPPSAQKHNQAQHNGSQTDVRHAGGHYLLAGGCGLRGLSSWGGMSTAAQHHRHAGRCTSMVGAEWILPEHCFPLKHTHTAHSTTAWEETRRK